MPLNGWRKIGEAGEIVAISQFFLEEYVHHCTGQRPVGAWPQHQVHIGLLGGRRAVRIDHHQLRARLPPGFLYPVHEIDLRVHWIAAPYHDQFGIHHLTRVDAVFGADTGLPAGIGKRDAECFVLPRPAGKMPESA